MIIGVTPFFKKDEDEMCKRIVNKKVLFPDREKFNIAYSDEFVDLVTLLLVKDPTDRLGFNGINEVLEHPWFADIDIEELIELQIEPPYKPVVKEVKINTEFFEMT